MILDNHQLEAGLSLVFPVGERPSAEDIEHLLSSGESQPGGVRISHRGEASEGWVELLVSGLTFDLIGLAPAEPSSPPTAAHHFGIDAGLELHPAEAITLVPGRHISGGNAMLPVVKAMAGLFANLALHCPAMAVCWHPARTWMDPAYFARIVLGWLSGGAFPALGFTAIESLGEGRVASSGLAFFVGQEIQVEARAGETRADTVKLAVRVIDYMVRNGKLREPRKLEGPSGETLLAEPSRFGELVLVWRDA